MVSMDYHALKREKIKLEQKACFTYWNRKHVCYHPHLLCHLLVDSYLDDMFWQVCGMPGNKQKSMLLWTPCEPFVTTVSHKCWFICHSCWVWHLLLPWPCFTEYPEFKSLTLNETNNDSISQRYAGNNISIQRSDMSDENTIEIYSIVKYSDDTCISAQFGPHAVLLRAAAYALMGLLLHLPWGMLSGRNVPDTTFLFNFASLRHRCQTRHFQNRPSLHIRICVW